MIDKEKRIVVFGDKDVKMGCSTCGIMFGKSDVPDNEDCIESSYEFGIAMTSTEIVDFHKSLRDIADKGELELVAYDTTIQFKTKDDLEEFMNHVLSWGAAVVSDTIILAEYIKSVVDEDKDNE